MGTSGDLYQLCNTKHAATTGVTRSLSCLFLATFTTITNSNKSWFYTWVVMLLDVGTSEMLEMLEVKM